MYFIAIIQNICSKVKHGWVHDAASAFPLPIVSVGNYFFKETDWYGK